jgi:hypothetical protein
MTTSDVQSYGLLAAPEMFGAITRASRHHIQQTNPSAWSSSEVPVWPSRQTKTNPGRSHEMPNAPEQLQQADSCAPGDWTCDSRALCMAARPHNLDTLSINPFAPPMRMHQGQAYDKQRQPMTAKGQAYDSQDTMTSTPRQPWQSKSSMPTAPDPNDLPLSFLAPNLSFTGNMVGKPLVDNRDCRNETAMDQIPTGAGSLSGFAPRSFEDPPTTLMIRNIPLKCTQEALLQEWPNNGTYDFFYLPCSCTLERNKSYAFINFTSYKAACEFEERWDANRLRNCRGRKSLNIGWACLQGLEANLCQLGKNWIWRQKVQGCQPLIFDKGELISIGEAFERRGLHNVEWSL